MVDKRFESGEDVPDFAHHLVVPGEAPLTRDEIKEKTVQLVTAGSEPVSFLRTSSPDRNTPHSKTLLIKIDCYLQCSNVLLSSQ